MKPLTTDELALFGGPKLIREPFQRYNPIGREEEEAVQRVMRTGVLSRYLGCWDPDFYGGDLVREFEKQWAAYFQVKHAISVNSCTSGLIAAVGALGIEPGDEVIVSPWTMCATATAILHWGAVPVFADIDPKTFNIDSSTIERCITPLTKAIVVTDIFGQAADLDRIMELAGRHKLKVIEDAAQAPGARNRDRYAGTIADIGVYSLNYHKHIHTGEGGVCVSNDPDLADRLQLIRNHAEAVVSSKGTPNLVNMVGYNFRMNEVEAAIGIEQLKKLEYLAAKRAASAKRLTARLRGLEGLQTPFVAEGNTHVYYVYSLILDPDKLGMPRQRIYDALAAEGVPNLMQGYQLLYMLPMYQKRIAFGSKGFPWSSSVYGGNVSYDWGICPAAEALHSSRYLGIGLCSSTYTDAEVDLVAEAFWKVWGNLDALRA